MNHLKPQSLLFYGVAIGSVVILFSVVTAYGEANLKAPLQVNGRYRFAAKALPPCAKGNGVLFLQQSGIYLSGSLIPETATPQQVAIAQEKPALQGRWQEGKILLSGPADRSICEGQILTFQGTVAASRFQGTLTLGLEKWDFVAEQEKPEVKPTTGH
ncbi:hypothetical protein BST81_06275 [Leptolyngbya sp. 'hensonii']|uniref:hypothetical protein n=1 Tax=Leptolyngbya sp. 'hensonii' TaxID=1922337 RepID=UPI00094FDADA|nr:hypothetical protein [Leptolyngbya sp. 'hensonii']OLP19353.1 hypothetical protein BST81_06275 [Leptolyngbya sp. 'hensonii']